MKQRAIATGLGLGLCGLAVYLLWPSTRAGSGPPPRAPVRSIERRANELDRIDRPVLPIITPRPAPEEEAESALESRVVKAQMIDVRVLVLSRRSQAPQPDLAIEIAQWPPLEGAVPVRGVTNAFGSATLRLEKAGGARGDRCSVTVGSPEKAQVFSGLPLREQLVVLVEDCARLHGRVRFHGVDPEVRAFVQLDEPARGAMASPVMLGRAAPARDGTFEVHACPPREIPWIDVRVLVGSIAALRRVRWEDLASEKGVEIDVTFTDLVVRVIDDAGAPLAGVDVRAAYVGASDLFPAVGITDSRGEYRATLEPAEVEVIAGRAGFASATERVQPSTGTTGSQVTLRLRRLGENDRLRGRVVREDGTAIDQALVTAAPALASADTAMAAVVQQRTASDGRFELAIAGGRELSVTAFRRDIGISDTLRFFADGREVEIVIRSQGSLEVRVEAPPGIAGFAGGRVEYLLVDRRFEHSHHGHEPGVPFQIEELPAGDYNVFVFVGGFGAYAAGSVRIEPEKTAVLNLASREAQFARGTVQGAARGMKLSLDHPTWPAEVEQVWSATLDEQGRFELLLGEETNCSALAVTPGGATQRFDLRAGNGNELSVSR